MKVIRIMLFLAIVALVGGQALPEPTGEHDDHHHWTCVGLHKHDWSMLCRLQGHSADNGDVQYLPWGYISENYRYGRDSTFTPPASSSETETAHHFTDGEPSEDLAGTMTQLQLEIYKVIHMSESDTVEPQIWNNAQYLPPTADEVSTAEEHVSAIYTAVGQNSCIWKAQCCIDPLYLEDGRPCCDETQATTLGLPSPLCVETFVYATRGHGPNVLSESCHTTIIERSSTGPYSVMVTKSREECEHYLP